MPTLQDTCTVCGSSNLFSAYVDEDDFAVSLNIGDDVPAGVRYTTFCNDCGAEQDKPQRRRKK